MIRKNSDWTTINRLTHKAAARHIFKRRMDAAAVCKAAQASSNGLYITHSFRDGCLKVGVSSYDAVAAVMMKQEALIATINNELGADEVKTIRVSVNPIAKEDDYR